jgi:hypothetical protein
MTLWNLIQARSVTLTSTDYIVLGGAQITSTSGNISITSTLGAVSFIGSTVHSAGELQISTLGTMSITTADLFSHIGLSNSQIYATANSITINAARLHMKGSDDVDYPCYEALFTETSGDIEINVTGSSYGVSLEGGSAANSYVKISAAGTLTIESQDNITIAGGEGVGSYAEIDSLSSVSTETGNLTLTGGSASGAYAKIANASGLVFDGIGGTLSLSGGSASGCYASIAATTIAISESKTIADGISCQGGSALNTYASILASSSLNLETNSSLYVRGGSGASSYASIDSGNVAVLTAAGSTTIWGGSGASNSYARIQSDGDLTFQSASLIVQGGTISTDNLACINNTGTSQGTYVIDSSVVLDAETGDCYLANVSSLITSDSNFGDVSLLGGTGGSAKIENTQGNLTLNVGRDLIITGGSLVANSEAIISTLNNYTLSVSIGRNLTLTGGSDGNSNYAGISPSGFLTSLSTQGNIVIAGNAAPAYITQLTLLNANSHSLSLTGGTGTSASAYISNSAGNITLTGMTTLTLTGGSAGTGNAAEIITTNNRDILITTTGEISLTGGASQATNWAVISSSGDTSITNAGRLTITANEAPAYIYGLYSLTSGSSVIITAALQDAYIHTNSTVLNVTGDLILNGNIGAAEIQGTAEDLFINVSNSVYLYGNAAIYNSGALLRIIAGQSLFLFNGTSGNPSIDNAVGEVTLVVDNDYPSSPGFDHGMFILEGNGRINSGGDLRIFTVTRGYNLTNGLLNGVSFVATEGFNSPQEQWHVYYPSLYFGGPDYTIFYKINPFVYYEAAIPYATLASADFMTLVDDTVKKWKILDLDERVIQQCRVWSRDQRKGLIKQQNTKIPLQYNKKPKEFLQTMQLLFLSVPIVVVHKDYNELGVLNHQPHPRVRKRKKQNKK